jgi:hypothetical protein
MSPSLGVVEGRPQLLIGLQSKEKLRRVLLLKRVGKHTTQLTPKNSKPSWNARLEKALARVADLRKRSRRLDKTLGGY